MQKNKRVVYTYGAFDLLHYGHVKLLESAKKLGDVLVVGILSDEAIKRRKGNDRPIQKQIDRMLVVGSLKPVDRVVSQEHYDPTDTLRRFHNIDVLTKGDDWDICMDAIHKYGRGEFIPLEYSKEYSTSSIVKKIKGSDDIIK